ncbi:oxidoreductase [Streptomyces sp. NPDC056061]|uniref:oxidoreductase n=1 Tax=Streptomyces sp. NPDC056061 TaxID=3345700 RepID=UPI0035DC7C15
MAWSTTDIPDQRGRTALITGATGAIGLETSRALAARGARVVLACRDTGRGHAVAARIGGRAEVLGVDLGSLDSVREAAVQAHHRYDRLDLLINNAGVLLPPCTRTQDGFEPHFGVNHLGHFALTGLLLDLVENVPGARVVTVSSLAHRLARGGAGDGVPGTGRAHHRAAAYGRSKLANLLFTRELQRRLAGAGSRAVALAAHPGVSATGLWSGVPTWLRPVSTVLLRGMAHPPAAAALPVLRAATDPLVRAGAYLGPDGLAGCRGAPGPAGSSRLSRDGVEQRRLWALSEELTGVRFGGPGPHGVAGRAAAVRCMRTGTAGARA